MSRVSFIKPRKKGEKSRRVQQEIKVLRCTFPVKGKEGIEVTLVQAKEINPPRGKSPLTVLNILTGLLTFFLVVHLKPAILLLTV